MNRVLNKGTESAYLPVNDLHKLVPVDLSVQVFFVQEIIDVDGSFGVSTENFTSFLASLVHSKLASRILARVVSELFGELLADHLGHLVVELSSAEVSIRVVHYDSGLSPFESGDSDSAFGMSDIHKRHDFLLLLIQLSFPEETVVEDDGSAFIDDSEALEASNFSCIQ